MICAHPGEYISGYLEDVGETQKKFAERVGVSPAVICRIINKKLAVSARMALKLEKEVGRSAESWMKMQAMYDLSEARSKMID